MQNAQYLDDEGIIFESRSKDRSEKDRSKERGYYVSRSKQTKPAVTPRNFPPSTIKYSNQATSNDSLLPQNNDNNSSNSFHREKRYELNNKRSPQNVYGRRDSHSYLPQLATVPETLRGAGGEVPKLSSSVAPLDPRRSGQQIENGLPDSYHSRISMPKMSQLNLAFIEIEKNDFKACFKFCIDNGIILNEPLDDFYQYALFLTQKGDRSTAERCIERYIIIRCFQKLVQLRGRKAAAEWLKDVAEGSKQAQQDLKRKQFDMRHKIDEEIAKFEEFMANSEANANNELNLGSRLEPRKISFSGSSAYREPAKDQYGEAVRVTSNPSHERNSYEEINAPAQNQQHDVYATRGGNVDGTFAASTYGSQEFYDTGASKKKRNSDLPIRDKMLRSQPNTFNPTERSINTEVNAWPTNQSIRHSAATTRITPTENDDYNFSISARNSGSVVSSKSIQCSQRPGFTGLRQERVSTSTNLHSLRYSSHTVQDNRQTNRYSGGSVGGDSIFSKGERPLDYGESYSEVGPRSDIIQDQEQIDILDQEFYVREEGHKFFIPGRVLALYLHDDAGHMKRDAKRHSGSDNGSLWHTVHTLSNGEKVFSHVRRAIVVKSRHGYSWILMITTYENKGLLGKKLSRQEIEAHSIVHDSSRKPYPIHGEPKMVKKPIAVDMDNEQDTIKPASRVHFCKPRSIEWNVRVKAIGMVAETSLANLTLYFDTEFRAGLRHDRKPSDKRNRKPSDEPRKG